MSIVFSKAGLAADIVDVKRRLTIDSCIRCLNKEVGDVAISVGRMEFTLCNDCFEYFVKTLNKFAEATEVNDWVNRAKKTV